MATVVSNTSNLHTQLTDKTKKYNDKILKITDSKNPLREFIHKTLDEKIHQQIKFGEISIDNPIQTFSDLKKRDVGRTLAKALLGLKDTNKQYKSANFKEIMSKFDQTIVEAISELQGKIKPNKKQQGGSGKTQYGGSENFILYLIATFVGTYLVVVGGVYLNNVQKTTTDEEVSIFGQSTDRQTAEIVFIMFILTGSFILCGLGRVLIPLFGQRAQQEDIYDIMERMGRANGQPAEQEQDQQPQPAPPAPPAPPNQSADANSTRRPAADMNLFDRLAVVNNQGVAVVNNQEDAVVNNQEEAVSTTDNRVEPIQPITRSNSPIVQAFWFRNQSVARDILRNVIPAEAYFPQTVSHVYMDNLVKTYAVLNVFVTNLNLDTAQQESDNRDRQSILVDNVLVCISASITGLNYLCKISLFHNNVDLKNNPENINRWIEANLPSLYKILVGYSPPSITNNPQEMQDYRLIDYIENEALYAELDITTEGAVVTENGSGGGKGRIRKSVKSRKTKRRRATRRRRTKTKSKS